MLEELKNYGLSENEARVYLASLEIGRATAETLSKHAEIKRPTTYVQIGSLTKKGLMSTYDEGKKTYFVPESPDALRRLLVHEKDAILQKERTLAHTLPSLEELFLHAGERPRVRFFNGKEGLITMREEILKAKNKELLALSSLDALGSVFSQKERDSYSRARAQNGIYLKALYTRKDGALSKINNPKAEMRFVPPEKLLLKTDIVIYDDTLALAALEGKLFGTLIQSPAIAQSMRALFTLLWEFVEN